MVFGYSGFSANGSNPKVITEGKNEIELKVFNPLSRDLLDVHFELGDIELPVWLKVKTPRDMLDISAGHHCEKPFILILNVTGGSIGDAFELPLKLKEKNGNQWDYSILLRVDIPDSGPIQFTLSQNIPNPFNPVTAIRYTIHKSCSVDLSVYDMIGRKVASLIHEQQRSGNHEVSWDGTDNNGEPVSSGVYFYRLIAGDRSKTRRMVLMK